MRGNRAADIEDIFARTARLQDGVADLDTAALKDPDFCVVDTAAITSGRVAAESAVVRLHPRSGWSLPTL